MLDEIMGNKTDLPIIEHAADTHGVTLVNGALFDLVAIQLSPADKPTSGQVAVDGLRVDTLSEAASARHRRPAGWAAKTRIALPLSVGGGGACGSAEDGR